MFRINRNINLGDSVVTYSGSACNRGGSSGVSMLELLVVLSLIGLLIVILQTPLSSLLASFDRNAVRRDFTTDLRRAQNEAMRSGARAIIEIAPGGMSYAVGLDLFPFSDSINDGQQLYQRVLPRGIVLGATANLIFDPRGYLIDEFGQLVAEQITIQKNGETYFSGTVFPTGILVN